MDDRLRLGLVQMTSTRRHADNIATAEQMTQAATQKGCQLVAFPEVAGMMNRTIAKTPEKLSLPAQDPYITACREMAKRHALWIHTGSTPVANPDEARLLNHSDLIDDTGALAASYDKMHLFDMYPEGAPPILESKRYAPGRVPALAETPWGPMGMTICYDLRFPALFRLYGQAGARLIFVPSAFTVPTGAAHWEVLLRARAIETGAFIVAAAQVGDHEDGRSTYGHGLVVSPWGKVLLDMEDTPGLAVIDLDLSRSDTARARIPSLTDTAFEM